MAEEKEGGDREETLVELGSRFLKKLGELVTDLEGSEDLHEDIDNAYIEKLKHYVLQWDQVDFNDLVNAISICTDLESDIDDLKNDVENLRDDEELKSEVSANSQAIEGITEDINGLDRRLVNIEKLYNIVRLALCNDGD